jgi:AcrR family transcriptional regulator
VARRTAAEAAQTRDALIAAARALFAEHGYQHTTAEAVVEAAGVTRGALYHHFTDKRDLFRAVVTDVGIDLNTHVRAVAAAIDDPRESYLTACNAAMDYAARPDYRRIALTDAPAVLGLDEWHRIDYTTSLATVGMGLKLLAQRGHINRDPDRALTVLLTGALTAACLETGRDDPHRPTRDELLDAFARLIDGLAVADQVDRSS